MAIIPSDLRARFPGVFDDPPTTDALINMVIAEASLYLNEDKWGDWYDIGLLYLTAHLLCLLNPSLVKAGGAGEGGSVSSRRVGDVAVTYSVATLAPLLSEEHYGATAYGRRFLELRRMIQGGPVVVEPSL